MYSLKNNPFILLNKRMVDRVAQMMAVQKEGLELFKKKNADYGDAFAKYSVVGAFVIMDKSGLNFNIQVFSLLCVVGVFISCYIMIYCDGLH